MKQLKVVLYKLWRTEDSLETECLILFLKNVRDCSKRKKLTHYFCFKSILNLNGNYEYNVKKKSICVEFVSANPTGLMHIGHARGAVFGDVLCAILEEVGHKITREYYINDAGEQIKKLLETIKFHLINDFASKDNLPENLYPGEYLRNVAEIPRLF